MTEITCRHGHRFQITSPDQVIMPEGYVICPDCLIDTWTGIQRYVKQAKKMKRGDSK